MKKQACGHVTKASCRKCGKCFACCPGHRAQARMGLDSIAVRGVWLRRDGDVAVVLAEIGDTWVEIIRESYDGMYSHIIEPSGIEERAKNLENEKEPQL